MDLAIGMLMEQLHCSPVEARRQLARLARESGDSITDLAAQITRQPPPAGADDPADPGARGLSLAWAAAQAAPDGTAVATALLDEVLADTGAVAVALWLLEPDGGLELAGQAGFEAREASRWRRIHPDMRTLARDVARDGVETWWPAGQPEGDDRPLMGHWPGGARAGLPLRDPGVTLGSMVICWPEPLAGFPAPLRRQLAALADLAAQALGAEHGGSAAGSRSWVFGLMDGLVGGFLFAHAVRDDDGEVTDFRIDHVSPGFRDPAGRGPAELAGRQLLELYPAAAAAGGLFDTCVTALVTDEPQRVSGEIVAAQAGYAGTGPVAAVRIARIYDGVAIASRGADDTGRLATLLRARPAAGPDRRAGRRTCGPARCTGPSRPSRCSGRRPGPRSPSPTCIPASPTRTFPPCRASATRCWPSAGKAPPRSGSSGRTTAASARCAPTPSRSPTRAVT